jgi:hypothetical protein
MLATSLPRFAVPVFATLLALALPAAAEDPLVKLAPTPMPAAGPTVAAATEFCGDAIGKAAELIERYSSRPGLKEVYKSDQYVAYSDDDKNSSVMYTFTAKGHPAYPAAVCRKPVQEGQSLTIKMTVVCDGEAEACNKLRNDFNVMTAKMQAQVDQQIAAQKK